VEIWTKISENLHKIP